MHSSLKILAEIFSHEYKAMITACAVVRSEAKRKKLFGMDSRIDDLPWEEAGWRLVSQPTANIQGLVAGCTGPLGKTVLPCPGVTKMDSHLVPGRKKDSAVATLNARRAKHRYGDIEVNVSGGYDGTQTSADSA